MQEVVYSEFQPNNATAGASCRGVHDAAYVVPGAADEDDLESYGVVKAFAGPAKQSSHLELGAYEDFNAQGRQGTAQGGRQGTGATLMQNGAYASTDRNGALVADGAYASTDRNGALVANGAYASTDRNGALVANGAYVSTDRNRALAANGAYANTDRKGALLANGAYASTDRNGALVANGAYAVVTSAIAGHIGGQLSRDEATKMLTDRGRVVGDYVVRDSKDSQVISLWTGRKFMHNPIKNTGGTYKADVVRGAVVLSRAHCVTTTTAPVIACCVALFLRRCNIYEVTTAISPFQSKKTQPIRSRQHDLHTHPTH